MVALANTATLFSSKGSLFWELATIGWLRIQPCLLGQQRSWSFLARILFGTGDPFCNRGYEGYSMSSSTLVKFVFSTWFHHKMPIKLLKMVNERLRNPHEPKGYQIL